MTGENALEFFIINVNKCISIIINMGYLSVTSTIIIIFFMPRCYKTIRARDS
ncbi:Uncharacterised protein [Serratia proteamaculans]|nr:Uncharacterised protein [Serratia proteamaculans]